MEISRSAYYSWRKHQTYRLSARKIDIEHQAKGTFAENKARYGARRIMHSLSKTGYKISGYKTAGIVREYGLKATQPRSFVPKTTDSRHSYRISPNLLTDRVWPTWVNEVWVCDITYIPLKDNRWCYLAVIMDLISRKIIGWQLGGNMKEQLVIDALWMALRKRKSLIGLIIHSDRVGQYASKLYRAILRRFRIDQSLSEADNPYENAFMESCFSRLKAELIQGRHYQSTENARADIFEYFEASYNRKRLHSGVGYHSPETYEDHLKNNLPSKCATGRRYIIPKKDFIGKRIDPLSDKAQINQLLISQRNGSIY